MKRWAHLLLLLFAVGAYSNNIPQHKQPNRACSHQPTETPQQTSNNFVAFPDQVLSRNCNGNTIYSYQEEDKLQDALGFFSGAKFPDWVIAFATFVIAGAAIAQYKWTKKMVILANRPRIVIERFRLHIDGETVQMPTLGMAIRYSVRNKGGTNATIIQNRVAIITGDRTPPSLPYETEELHYIGVEGRILKPGEPWFCDYEWKGTSSLFEVFEKATRGLRIIVLFGFVEFRDDAGGADRVYFKRWWNPQTHAFEHYKS